MKSTAIKLLSGVVICILGNACIQEKISVSSPDNKVFISIINDTLSLRADIAYKDQFLFSISSLGISFLESGDFKSSLKLNKPTKKKGLETYELTVGKTRMVHEYFNELLIPLYEESEKGRKINVIFRVFNDGIAFRYEIPEQENISTMTITDELTSFSFPSDPRVLALLLPDYTTSHEGEYSELLFSEIKEDTLIDMPALFDFSGKIYASITEAALHDYAGMYLSKRKGALHCKLSPLPGQNEIKVKGHKSLRSPWRVVLLSDRIGALLESNIITNLNEPSKMDSTGWIKTGKTTWPWWNGNILPDTFKNGGNNFETNKYYIDFCAKNNIEYHSVVEYANHSWYTDDGKNFQPGPHADITTPVPGIDMKQICDYAHSKNVDIRVWVHWAALYPKLDTAFVLFEEWGISGMMIDFMDRDDQEMVNIQEEMLQKAGKHKMHIQFHGAYKPTGMHRTYPNELTREGTLNYEVNKWAKRITPDHDLNIIYTRMIAGASDYHLGGFRATPDSIFKVQFSRPLMLGTRCHMLAMYVILESYLSTVADYPEAYENQVGFEFIRKVPTTWDEIKVLDGVLHQYIIIARRKGTDWYIGSVTNQRERKINIKFDFLPHGKYTVTIFRDANDTNLHPDQLIRETRQIQSTENISIQLNPGGGCAMHLSSTQ